MQLLSGIYNILGEFLVLDNMRYWFFPLLALGFIATLPSIVRSFLEWR